MSTPLYPYDPILTPCPWGDFTHYFAHSISKNRFGSTAYTSSYSLLYETPPSLKFRSTPGGYIFFKKLLLYYAHRYPQKGVMNIQVEPTLDKPIPIVADAMEMEDLNDHAKVMGNTALLLQELGDGATFDLSEEENEKAIEMFRNLGKKTDKTAQAQTREDMKRPGVALQLASYINEYEKQVISDKVQVRTIVMNRLLQISNDDDNRTALKALELLGKASDLFTEKQEITITHKTSDELKEAIRDRIRTLMQLNTFENTPTHEKLANSLDITDVEVNDQPE